MHKFLLALIIIIGFTLRVINLSQYPVGFTPDEASFGYDAYSLLKTGRDQWGHQFPIVFESFGDYKPPLYGYLLIPFIWIGGLEEHVVRLPNALMGSLAILITYLLVQETTYRVYKKKNEFLSLLSAFVISISSWHIMMSRGAFEANVTTFLMPLGLYSIVRGLRTPRYLYLASIILGLNMFSYHSPRLLVPLILVAIAGIFWHEISSLYSGIYRKYIIRSLIFFSIFLAISVYSFSLGAGTRAKDISVFSGAMEAASLPRLTLIEKGTPELIAKSIHNQYTVAFMRFINNYSQYYSRKFLLTEGPAEATYGMIPGRGVLYPIEAFAFTIFIVYVVSYVLKTKSSLKPHNYKERKTIYSLVIILLIAPIPASLAMGTGYSANRFVIVQPFLSIAIAIGIFCLYQFFQYKIPTFINKSVFVLYVIISAFSLNSFLLTYLLTSPPQTAPAMLYGRKQMIEYLQAYGYTPYTTPVVIDKRLSEPQIFVAFYMKLDPVDYQQWSQKWSIYKEKDVRFVDQLDEYEMGSFLFTTNFVEKEKRFGSTYVLVGKPEEFPRGITPDKTINYPNGDDAIYIFDSRVSELVLF